MKRFSISCIDDSETWYGNAALAVYETCNGEWCKYADVEEFQQRFAAVEADNERLKTALAATVRTADGVVITDNMCLFRYVADMLITMPVQLCYMIPPDDDGRCRGAIAFGWNDWYSTEQAARAASQQLLNGD